MKVLFYTHNKNTSVRYKYTFFGTIDTRYLLLLNFIRLMNFII